MAKPASQKKPSGKQRSAPTKAGKQRPAPTGIGKRHQQRSEQEETTICSLPRAKRVLAINGVSSSTTQAKRTFGEFGYELLGLIAAIARNRAQQKRRRTIQPADVVESLQRRARLIIATPERKKTVAKKSAPDTTITSS